MVKKMRDIIAQAVKRSHEFFGFEPRRLEFEDVDIQSLTLIGSCPEVRYICDKYDGVHREYKHRFLKRSKSRIFFVTNKQRNGDQILIIRGKFQITENGIVG